MPVDLDQHIRLISIETERMPSGLDGKEITFRYEKQGDSVTGTYVVDDFQVRDEELVNVARDWFR